MTDKILAEKCPMCEDGIMSPFSDGVYEFSHSRKKHKVNGLHYAKCDVCETSGYLPGQRKYNNQLIENYQKELLDFVSLSDILAVREKYTLTQKQANIIFGGGVNAFSKWERGEVIPSGAIARIIKSALLSTEVMRTLAEVSRVAIEIVENCVESAAVKKEIPMHAKVMTYSCTHTEYSDDVVSDARNDEFDSDDGNKWILNTTSQQPQYLN
ncbi:type II TA system antitoxin MqsA family protein [Janthinobacterium sp. LB3P118]|uniref:type II TA system antitoxin MqsA family protein n=1 Tax=Janthinobacterium sp. LB3P118 TaxID=3424195 RepID=UPI003F2469EE